MAAAIYASKQRRSVLVLEKGKYPRHKVCGEYLSKETIRLLNGMGINLKEEAVSISNLTLSSTSGKTASMELPLGGLGISRFKLEKMLFDLCVDQGVTFLCNQEVTNIRSSKEETTCTLLNGMVFKGQLLLSAVGKHSRLTKQPFRKGSFVAFKNYYKADWNNEKVGLYNFNGGYCGLSKVETGDVNVCLMVKQNLLKKHKNLDQLIEHVLTKNPLLRDFFKQATPVLDKPLTASNINFENRPIIDNGVFSAGDNAGMIYPLAGNGMAIALQQGTKFAELANDFFLNKISRNEIEILYESYCQKNFSRRKFFGKLYQLFMGNKFGSLIAIRIMGLGTFFSSWIIKQTHGSNSTETYIQSDEV